MFYIVIKSRKKVTNVNVVWKKTFLDQIFLIASKKMYKKICNDFESFVILLSSYFIQV